MEKLKEADKEPIEDIIRSVAGSMALSGLQLTEEDKERIWLFAEYPDEVAEIVRQLVEKHKKEGKE